MTAVVEPACHGPGDAVDVIIFNETSMKTHLLTASLFVLGACVLRASAQYTPDSSTERAQRIREGGRLYSTLCATCHGANREGHRAEQANSLNTQAFLTTANRLLVDYAIRYGRPRTAMAAYADTFGGPLSSRDIEALTDYIFSFRRGDATVETAVAGDPRAGKAVYERQCRECHGVDGEGGAGAPSLNDRLFLAVASKSFIRSAVSNGRENTSMRAFAPMLTSSDLDNVSAYIKSWSSAWTLPDAVTMAASDLRHGILNGAAPAPRPEVLRSGRYVSVDWLRTAVTNSRLLLIDVRVASAWATGHIPGAQSLPYYDAERRLAELPQDETWIVTYCSCPTHLADQITDLLRRKGFRNVATLDEGIAGWVARGLPLRSAAHIADADGATTKP